MRGKYFFSLIAVKKNYTPLYLEVFKSNKILSETKKTLTGSSENVIQLAELPVSGISGTIFRVTKGSRKKIFF